MRFLSRFGISLGLLLWLWMPALAQLAPAAPVRQNVDARGVDLFLGTYNVSSTPLTMGQGEPQGIAYYRLNKGQGWSDNVIATLNLSGGTMIVGLGGTSDAFTVSGGSYLPTQGNGATLSFDGGTQIYTYTRADGTLVHFAKANASTYPYYSNEGRVSDITFPAGGKLVFSYARS